MIASQNGHFQVVELLVKEHSDINQQDEDEWTALIIASENGHFQVVELLLKEQADINQQEGKGWTAPMIAITMVISKSLNYYSKNMLTVINERKIDGLP